MKGIIATSSKKVHTKFEAIDNVEVGPQFRIYMNPVDRVMITPEILKRTLWLLQWLDQTPSQNIP